MIIQPSASYAGFSATRPERAASPPQDGFSSSPEPAGTPTAAQLRQLFHQSDSALGEFEVWRAKIAPGNNTPPALTPDGSLIIQTDQGLVTLSSRGEKTGETRIEGLSSYAVPLRDQQGNVFLSTLEGMTCVRPQGTIGWQKPFGSTEVAPVFGPEGTLYHGNYSGVLRRIDAEGNQLWERHVNPEDENTHINWAMVSLPTGEVVANEDPGILHCFDQDGKHRWTKFKDSPDCKEVAVTPEGELLVTLDGNSLACYDRDGKTKWHYDSELGRPLKDGEEAGTWGNTVVSSQAVLSPDGQSIFVAGSSGTLTSLDRQGNQRWVREFDLHTNDRGVQVGEDGTVYLCDGNGGVHALDPDSGETRWEFHTGAHQQYTNIATRGDMVYLSTHEGDVHALSQNALKHRVEAAELQEQQERPTQIELGPNRVIIGGAWLRTRKPSAQ
jgi:outer membrane protein assembly factor BamB